MRKLPASFRRKAEKLVAFAERNGWSFDMTKKNHVALRHAVCGIYFTASTPSDTRGPYQAMGDLKAIMKQRGLPIK